jgi:hypothetical protein
MNNTDLFAGLALIVSNIALFPVIALASYKKVYTLACFFSCLFCASSIYHVCQANFYCFTTFHNHQVIDHFFVYSTFIWTLFYFLKMSLELSICILIVFQLILILCIMKWIESWALAGIIMGTLLILTIVILLIYGPPKFDKIDLICALILIGIGFFLHVWAGDPGDSRYPFSHSLWHVLAMLSGYFVIEIRDGKSVLYKLLHKDKNKNQIFV